MGQNVRISKRKPMVRWTPRQLSELVRELDRLKQQVRIAETKTSKRKVLPARRSARSVDTSA